jgi:hypothetical protein
MGKPLGPDAMSDAAKTKSGFVTTRRNVWVTNTPFVKRDIVYWFVMGV